MTNTTQQIINEAKERGFIPEKKGLKIKHFYDYETMVCVCGKTYEQHFNIELINEKIKQKWLMGDVDLDKDFAELDKVLLTNKE